MSDIDYHYLVHEMNRLLLHPLGYALMLTDDELELAETTEGEVFYTDPNPEAASAVANRIEERGASRVAHLGYVVQPVDPAAKQLHVTVKEPTEWTVEAEDEDRAAYQAYAAYEAERTAKRDALAAQSS